MSEWQPIETFDYERESKRQRTSYVNVWATDGVRSEPVQHWGDADAGGKGPWLNITNPGHDGAESLEWTPTHWLPIPDPPPANPGFGKYTLLAAEVPMKADVIEEASMVVDGPALAPQVSELFEAAVPGLRLKGVCSVEGEITASYVSPSGTITVVKFAAFVLGR